MTEKTRNLVVGTMVLLALIILCAMIIIFHELPASIRPGYTIYFTSRNTGGTQEGSDVLLNGIRIGRISKIYFTQGDPSKGVTLVASIEPGVKIPRNIVAHFQSGGLGGATIIQMKTLTRPSSGKKPTTAKPQDRWLPTDRPVTIPVDWPNEYGGGLLPGRLVIEISDTLKSVKRMTETLTDLINPAESPDTTSTTTRQGNARTNLKSTLAKLDKALTAIATVLGDKENQENIKVSLKNLKSATSKAVEAMESFKSTLKDAKAMLNDVSGMARSASLQADRLLASLMEQADNVGQVLTSLQHIIKQVETGKGSLGRLVNNPDLYEGLVDAADQLKITLETLQQVLAKWKQKGIKIHLGK